MEIHSNLLSDVVKFFRKELHTIYTSSELQNITNWVFEKQLQLTTAQILSDKNLRINQSDLIILEQMCFKLKEYMPIQYVLGEAEFYHLKFKVNQYVLIPRPETEELVEQIIKDAIFSTQDFRLLDIGTGSGCIPVSIKKNIPHANIYALDVSVQALQIAEENARLNKTEVHFFQADVLKDNIVELILEQTKRKKIDILVSNPPYVLNSEKNELENRVKNYEPHIALFVNDIDPILFYRKIAHIAKQLLADQGKLYFECHTAYANDVCEMLAKAGYKNIVLGKDMAQMPRFVSASF